MSKFSRSWSLIKASFGVLRQGKRLFLFPLCSGLAALMFFASFVVLPLENYAIVPNLILALLGLLFYFSIFFVSFFFNSALTGAALILLDGGNPTIADGIAIAQSKLGNIIGYALFSSTIGMGLQLIGVLLSLIGMALRLEAVGGFVEIWIGRLIGFAYMSATYLVVPVLVSQNISPLEALKESAKLLKKTWGENIIGIEGMDAIFGPLYILLFISLVAGTAGSSGGTSMIIFWGVHAFAFIMLATTSAMLRGIYAAALYRYAITGNIGNNYSDTHLEYAFKK